MKRIILALAVLSMALGMPVHASASVTDGINPDFTAVLSGGPSTVIKGGTFTRTLTVANIGTGGSYADGTIRGISYATVVSVTSSGFRTNNPFNLAPCSVIKFSTGALNYVRCYGAYLNPGETATMTVTYKASAWVGYVYTGGGYTLPTGNAYEPNTTNNYNTAVVETKVI